VFLAAIMVISVFAAGIAFSGSAAAAVTNVSDGESIQSAINGANPGDTIIVEAGTYDESVTVNVSDITVEGPNTGTSGDGTRSTEATIEHGVVIAANNVTFAGFEVNNDDVNGITVSGAPDDVTITNNLVTDVGGGTAGPKGVGNGINLQYTDSFEETSSGIEITDNQITNITTSDNASGDADAIGIQVLPRGNDVEDLLIQGNAINDIEPGDNAGGRAEARGISVDTQFQDTPGGTRGDFGQATNLTIDDNKIRNLNSEFSRAIGLFEDKGGDTTTNDAIGPVNFSITNNTIEQITSTSDLPAESIFVGGYQDMGTAHEVRNNNFLAIVENFGDSSNTLNAEDNWWGSANGPTASANTYNNGSQGTPVIGNVDFTPWLDASTDSGGQSFAPVTNDSGGQFASIQATVDAASLGDTITVSSGTYQESVVIESGNVSLVGNDNPTIIGDGVGSEPQAAIHVDDSSGPVRNVTIRGLTVENPDGKFGIFAGTGSTNNDPDGIGGLVISNNAIQDVSTDSTGSALTGGPAGIGIRGDYGTDGNPGIEISNNEIDNVENLEGGPEPVGITLKSFTGDAGFGVDSNGDSLTDPVSPPATDTDILNNEISNISSNGGFATKGISVSGEFEDVDIIDNQLKTVESPGGDARAITLSENSLKPDVPASYEYDIDGDGNGERIGPQDFDIRGNTISDVNASDARSINFGGYEKFGDHSITQNTINDGAVTRFAGDQPGFQPGDGDALNFSGNTFTSQDTDVYFDDPSQSADLNTVFESNTFEKPVTIEDDAGNLNSSSIFGAIQPAVDEASPNAGTPGYSDDRGEEAVISRTDKPGSGGAAVTITADETTVDGFQIESDAQDGISVPQAVDDVAIVANSITSVEGNTFGSNSGDRATGNGIAFGLPKDNDGTVTGVVVAGNEITGVTTTDLAASDDRTTANGIQVLTRDNDVERMNITGNVIRDLEPGASGDTGDSRARGIVVNVGGDGPVGEADEFNIDDNEIRNLTGDGGGGSDLAGIALFETKDVRPYVGPTNFSIEGNTIDDVANEGSGPPTALFVGGYEELGNHIVRYNNFQNGLVVRFSRDQPGFSRSEGETLNARLNWWNSTDGPAGENSSTAASGFLALDPFLTAPSDQVDKFNDEGEIITRQFGTDLSLESGVNAIAFPAPSERSLSESVNLTNVEAVYRYDNSNGGWTQLNGSDPTPSALDVYVIVVEEGETAEVVMEFENDRPENPVFESQVISGGWNLIAPTEADRSDDEAFGTQRAEISTIPPNQPFDDPSSQPYAVEDGGFSPYEGYWAFIDDDPGQSTLASNTFDGITYEEFLENADIVQLGN
jgi:surface glycoprotein (TIGR04207 family)